MDMTDEIERLQVQDFIQDFVAIINDTHKNDLLCQETIFIMQTKLNNFLNSLTKNFSYDYDVYIDEYSRVKFKFDIKRRYHNGFLGPRGKYYYSK